ncbi:MAG TPA: hypothetical protein VGA95_05075 [Thermodesulfobacteriota bacterium]
MSKFNRLKMLGLFWLCLVFLFLAFVDCGASRTVINKKPESKSYNYQVVEIPDFGKTDQEWVPLDSYSEIPDMVAEELRNNNHFRKILRTKSDDSLGERILLVQGTMTGYDRGCKYCEWYSFGINDKGKGVVYVGIQLIDKNTGLIITDADVSGRAKDPGYGRSKYIRVTDEIVDLIQHIND